MAASAGAQGLTGQIGGTITDAGGGVIPGVTVTLTNGRKTLDDFCTLFHGQHDNGREADHQGTALREPAGEVG